MLRSCRPSRQLGFRIHALISLKNAVQDFNLPAQARALSSLLPGNEFHCVKQFTQEDVQAFLKLTGDANSIHTDNAAAKAAGLQGPIVPGIMMASLFPAIIGTNFPGAIYLTQTLKFRQPAQVGSWVKATVKLEKLSGSRASFLTECSLLPSPINNEKSVPKPDSIVLLEGQALAIIKDLH